MSKYVLQSTILKKNEVVDYSKMFNVGAKEIDPLVEEENKRDEYKDNNLEISDFIDKKSQFLDSRWFIQDIETIKEYISSNECSITNKFDLSNILLNKWRIYIKNKWIDRREMVSEICKSIVIYRLLNFGKSHYFRKVVKDPEFDMNIANYYHKNFTNLTFNQRFNSDSFIINNIWKYDKTLYYPLYKSETSTQTITDEDSLKDHFIGWWKDIQNDIEINSVYLNKSQSEKQQSNILDILMLHFASDPQVKEIKNYMSFGHLKFDIRTDNLIKSKYDDKQNVHDDVLSNEHKRVTYELIKWEKRRIDEIKKHFGKNEIPSDEDRLSWSVSYVTNYFIKKNDPNKLPTELLDSFDKIKESSEIYIIDYSNYESSVYLLSQLFNIIVWFIFKSKNEDDLMDILYSELIEMKDWCSTGHFTRLLNVVQGQNIEEFNIKIPYEDRLKEILLHHISTEMKTKDIDSDIVEGTYKEEKRKIYTDFIMEFINNLIPELSKDEGEDFNNNIVSSLEKTIGFFDIFDYDVENKKLIYKKVNDCK